MCVSLVGLVLVLQWVLFQIHQGQATICNKSFKDGVGEGVKLKRCVFGSSYFPLVPSLLKIVKWFSKLLEHHIQSAV